MLVILSEAKNLLFPRRMKKAISRDRAIVAIPMSMLFPRDASRLGY
jgi:hypothetical protein